MALVAGLLLQVVMLGHAEADPLDEATTDTEAPASSEDLHANVQLLERAELTLDDLPLDAEGRSARDGRTIPGIVPRNVMPEALKREHEAAQAVRAEINDGLISDDAPVLVEESAIDKEGPPRMDSGHPDPDGHVTELQLPAAVREQ